MLLNYEKKQLYMSLDNMCKMIILVRQCQAVADGTDIVVGLCKLDEEVYS